MTTLGQTQNPDGSQGAPTVDIGLTAYRRATYIREAIESVLAQTFDRWRLTVCDNGPGGGEIEEAVQPYLTDTRVAHLVTGRELGQAENWSVALNQGNAPYVAVLNDDDRWHPEYLQARVDALEEHPECAFAFSDWVSIDEHGQVTAHTHLSFEEGVMSRQQLARVLVRANPVVPPAILCRRSACVSVGSFFDETWQYNDWELWARLAARFPVYYLARRDNDFRRHSEAYAYSEREPPDQLLDMIDHLERLFSENVDDFSLPRVERARIRSRILLRAAADVHAGVGWKGSGPTYRRALTEYPPTFFDPVSLRMVTKSLLGRRGTRVVSRVLSVFRDDGARGSAPA